MDDCYALVTKWEFGTIESWYCANDLHSAWGPAVIYRNQQGQIIRKEWYYMGQFIKSDNIDLELTDMLENLKLK